MDSSLPTTLRERNRRRTRLDITKAALDLFLTQGYEQVSAEAICEKAGVSRATFFNYFSRKDELLAALVTARVEVLRELFRELARKRKRATLEQAAGIFAKFCDENEFYGERARHLLTLMLLSPSCREAHRELREQAITALTGIIESWQEGKPGRSHPARAVAEMIFSLYMACAVEWLTQDDAPPGSLAKIFRSRMKMAMEGICPKG